MHPPHEWLTTLANDVAVLLHPLLPLPPLGCHFFQADGTSEIAIFPSQTEIVGGPQDGRRVGSPFRVDILRLMRLFTRVEKVKWQSAVLDDEDELAAHLTIVGEVNGERVCVRILAEAPTRFEVGRKALVHDGLMLETW
jgi:hypothetical protein